MFTTCRSHPFCIAHSSVIDFKPLILEGFFTCRSDGTLRMCQAFPSHRGREEGPRVQEERLCPPHSLHVAFEVSTWRLPQTHALSSESRDFPGSNVAILMAAVCVGGGGG